MCMLLLIKLENIFNNQGWLWLLRSVVALTRWVLVHNKVRKHENLRIKSWKETQYDEKNSHLNNVIDWIPTHSFLSQSMLSVPVPSLRTRYEIPTPTSASEVASCFYFTDWPSGMLSFAKRLSGVNMHQHHYRLDFLETCNLISCPWI